MSDATQPSAVTMELVASSNIAAVGYDDAQRYLYVEFTSGETYRFFDVPPNVHAALVGAESVGKYFSANVKNAYQWDKVTA